MRNFNFYSGIFVASTFLAVLVIVAELAPPFKALLASFFAHHWVAKAVLTTAVFVFSGFVYKKDKLFGISVEKIAWYSTLGSLTAIFLFFILHFFV